MRLACIVVDVLLVDAVLVNVPVWLVRVDVVLDRTNKGTQVLTITLRKNDFGNFDLLDVVILKFASKRSFFCPKRFPLRKHVARFDLNSPPVAQNGFSEFVVWLLMLLHTEVTHNKSERLPIHSRCLCFSRGFKPVVLRWHQQKLGMRPNQTVLDTYEPLQIRNCVGHLQLSAW